jgi:hypothetical protein
MTHDGAGDLGGLLEEIDRLEERRCAGCERRARVRAFVRASAIGAAIAFVVVAGLCLALDRLLAGLPRFG